MGRDKVWAAAEQVRLVQARTKRALEVLVVGDVARPRAPFARFPPQAQQRPQSQKQRPRPPSPSLPPASSSLVLVPHSSPSPGRRRQRYQTRARSNLFVPIVPRGRRPTGLRAGAQCLSGRCTASRLLMREGGGRGRGVGEGLWETLKLGGGRLGEVRRGSASCALCQVVQVGCCVAMDCGRGLRDKMERLEDDLKSS